MPFGELIIVIFGILFSLSIHESAHAWLADRAGDPTAHQEGRISLNPVNHWDPVGTTLLVGLLILSSIGLSPFIFGWGKPVPVVQSNLNHPKNDQIRIAIFGPISNLLVALAFGLLFRYLPLSSSPILLESLILLVSINVTLAIFNLLPIPPLDGSNLLALVLSESQYEVVLRNWQYFILIIMGIVWFFPIIIEYPIHVITNLILG